MADLLFYSKDGFLLGSQAICYNRDMIEQLFGSKTRVKLLQLFMSNPNRSFYVREITRKIDEQINSVRRELANLLSIGIISSDNTNNRLYYEVDQKFEFYNPLAIMFGGKAPQAPTEPKKAVVGAKKEVKVEEPAPGNPLAEEFKLAGHLKALILTGQFTRDEMAGVDLVVIGDMNNSKVENAVTALEASEGKQVRYAVFTVDEFKYRRQINDRFISNVLIAKKQVLYDEDDLLK